MVPTSRQNNVLDALLGTASFTAPATSMNTRLDSTAPSASASGTELPNGGGYATLGKVTTYNSSSAGTTTSITSLSWPNSSGSAWSVVGIECNDASANRYLYGQWTSQPIAVNNGNTLAVAPAAIAPNAASF
jgi:hypothetical protein